MRHRGAAIRRLKVWRRKTRKLSLCRGDASALAGGSVSTWRVLERLQRCVIAIASLGVWWRRACVPVERS